MKGGIRVGKVFGIPLFADPTLLLILAFMSINFSVAYSRFSPNFGWLLGLATAFLLFGSLLIHELAHIFVAKTQGIEIDSTTLYLFGGLTSHKQEVQNLSTAIRVAIAGPAVSFGLGLGLITLGFSLGGQWITANNLANPASISNLITEIGVVKIVAALMTFNLGTLNLILAVLNLIPGLPLDGGQILKAIVWQVTGDYFMSIRVAARSGQVFGWIGLIAGLAVFFRPEISGLGLWLVFFGWMILFNASAFMQLTFLQESLVSVTAESAMTRDFRIIDANMPLRQFADEFLLMQEKELQPIYIASANGRDRGMVSPAELRHIDRLEWTTKTLESITTPIKSLDTVEQTARITDVINTLETKQIRRVTVLSPVGSVAGIIDHGDVMRALFQKLNWRVPEIYIKQIKTEGKFPANMNLLEIISQISPSSYTKKPKPSK